jgi:hypothetical protein
MPDGFLSPPRRSGYGGVSAREARILRDRQAAHNAARDRTAERSPSFSSARLIGQVFNSGSMPAVVPAVYLTQPVLVTGAETEGSSGTLTVDPATIVPVVVLGPKVPSVGDYLTAYAVGGRWVSERGTGSSGGGVTTCSPCSIPNENLTLSWTNPLSGNGSATMTYAPGISPTWTTGCASVSASM